MHDLNKGNKEIYVIYAIVSFHILLKFHVCARMALADGFGLKRADTAPVSFSRSPHTLENFTSKITEA